MTTEGVHVSPDFWEDDDGQARVEVDARLHARLGDPAARLTTQWGKASVVDLGPYLSAGCAGEPVPEPFDHLSQQAVSMQGWSLPDSGRLLALAVGQADKELPLILLGRVSGCDQFAGFVLAAGPGPVDRGV